MRAGISTQQASTSYLVAARNPMVRGGPAVTPSMGPRANGSKASEGRSAWQASWARLTGHQHHRQPARQSTRRPTPGGRDRTSSGEEHRQNEDMHVQTASGDENTDTWSRGEQLNTLAERPGL
jgi:hypothetical protein